jgi:parallel beta-helix repeat protein
MKQLVTRAPLASLRALCCAGLAMLATSCGVRETTGQPGMTALEPPANPVTAYHLYVGPNGADSNPGTETAPFRSIERAAQVAFPDTTVHVAPGSYAGGFKTLTNGTPKARVYYLSTMRWGAKIVPPLNSSTPIAWDNRGNYVDIVGFDIDGTVYQGGLKWLHGIYSGGSYDSIRHNHIHHIATTVTCTDADGAGVGVDSYYHGVKSEVIGNNIHDIGPAGCHAIQGIYINTPGTVANNIVYRVAYAGIHLWHDANNVTIANNTVSASTSGILVGGGDYYYTSGPNDHTNVSNNIVYDNKNGILEQGATGKNNSYNNNLVFQNASSDWHLANGIGHSGSVAAPPQFLSYSRTGTPDFRLSSTSPAIGKGSAAHANPRDFMGAPRNAASGVDIGAFQH